MLTDEPYCIIRSFTDVCHYKRSSTTHHFSIEYHLSDFGEKISLYFGKIRNFLPTDNIELVFAELLMKIFSFYNWQIVNRVSLDMFLVIFGYIFQFSKYLL
jgi:hypothetical protein